MPTGGKVMLGMSLLLQESNSLSKERKDFWQCEKGTLAFHI